MPSLPPHVVVIGSINMDLVLQADRAPDAGETLPARELRQVPGGKGANQAVAAARLGARVSMVGRVGDDELGATLLAQLAANEVDTRHVIRTPGYSSGVAVIVVEASGENRILVVPGANGQVTPDDVAAARATLAAADVCLLQLELPLATVAAAATLCAELGVRVVLDPAPAQVLPPALWQVDVLTPNASEAVALGIPNLSEADPPGAIAQALIARGPRAVVLKRGASGAVALADSSLFAAPAVKVQVLDTTAAGDAFTAGLAVALAEGRDWPMALRWATAAGSLACRVMGAQPSLPRREAVAELV